MNLGKWELDFDDHILARGKRYHEEGRVSELTWNEDTHTWTADVEGSDVYHVSVEMTGDAAESLIYSCTCPYSGAPYCKHTAAVLFAIEEDADDMAQDSECTVPGRMLHTLSKNQLAELVMEICQSFPDVDGWLKARLAPKDDVIPRYRSLIRTTAYDCRHHGYISYYDIGRALTGAESALAYLRDLLIPAGDPLLALDFAHMVLVETMAIFDIGDDSDGSIGDLIEQTLDEIRELYELKISNAASAEQRSFFERILRIACSDLFRGWEDWSERLLDICIEIADGQPDLRSRVMKLYEEKMQQCEQDRSSFPSYSLAYAQKAIHALLCRWETAETAQAFLLSHPENESFCSLLIQQYRDKGCFQEAIDLCTSAEKRAREAGHSGTERRWKELRYDILSQQGDRSSMIALAQELLLDGSDAYYERLKTLVPAEEWEQMHVQLLERIAASNRFLYQHLILRDRDTARIIQYVRAHPSWIYEAYEPLVSEYPEDVCRLLTHEILNEAMRASTRTMYRGICQHIALLHRVSGAQAAESLISQLQLAYRRKSAFMDELGKISQSMRK
ncbi:MAG: SWIM zinc finger family protein [Aristaeellaceae bacterium]